MKRLASQRSDVFDGVTGQPVISEEEAARRKRAAVGAYDGVSGQGKGPTGGGGVKEGGGEGMAGMGLEEQIRQIHQKYKN